MKRVLLESLQAARRSKRPAALVTDLGDGQQALIADGDRQGDLALDAGLLAAVEAAIQADRSGPLAEDDRLFAHVFNPPLRLIAVGAVHISQALVPMAQLAGYEVLMVDPRKAWANAERFPDVALVEGWPDEAAFWASPDGVLRRVEWAAVLGDKVGNLVNPLTLIDGLLGPLASRTTLEAVRGAESFAQGVALVFSSSEFQRR